MDYLISDEELNRISYKRNLFKNKLLYSVTSNQTNNFNYHFFHRYRNTINKLGEYIDIDIMRNEPIIDEVQSALRFVKIIEYIITSDTGGRHDYNIINISNVIDESAKSNLLHVLKG